jgi:hypothetical protein
VKKRVKCIRIHKPCINFTYREFNWKNDGGKTGLEACVLNDSPKKVRGVSHTRYRELCELKEEVNMLALPKSVMLTEIIEN